MSDNLETLYCQEGEHEWRRERKRGKKPTSCPEHKAEKLAADMEERLRLMAEGRERAQRERNREKVQAILDTMVSTHHCRCYIAPEATWAELRRLGGGCTMPRWCCPVLDRVRRELEPD